MFFSLLLDLSDYKSLKEKPTITVAAAEMKCQEGVDLMRHLSLNENCLPSNVTLALYSKELADSPTSGGIWLVATCMVDHQNSAIHMRRIY